MVFPLSHRHKTLPDREKTGTHGGYLGLDCGLCDTWLGGRPELDLAVLSTSDKIMLSSIAPVEAIDLGVVGRDERQRSRVLPDIPHAHLSTMSTGKDVWVSAVPLDLRGTIVPRHKGLELLGTLPRLSQIPDRDLVIRAARGQVIPVKTIPCEATDETAVGLPLDGELVA